jgi:hypothetical protein
MMFDHLDNEWAKELESGLEKYLGTLSDYAYGELEDGDLDSFETLSGELYCGCTTCEIREILAFVVPKAISGMLDGKIIISIPEDTVV